MEPTQTHWQHSSKIWWKTTWSCISVGTIGNISSPWLCQAITVWQTPILQKNKSLKSYCFLWESECWVLSPTGPVDCICVLLHAFSGIKSNPDGILW